MTGLDGTLKALTDRLGANILTKSNSRLARLYTNYFINNLINIRIPDPLIAAELRKHLRHLSDREAARFIKLLSLCFDVLDPELRLHAYDHVATEVRSCHLAYTANFPTFAIDIVIMSDVVNLSISFHTDDDGPRPGSPIAGRARITGFPSDVGRPHREAPIKGALLLVDFLIVPSQACCGHAILPIQEFANSASAFKSEAGAICDRRGFAYPENATKLESLVEPLFPLMVGVLSSATAIKAHIIYRPISLFPEESKCSIRNTGLRSAENAANSLSIPLSGLAKTFTLKFASPPRAYEKLDRDIGYLH